MSAVFVWFGLHVVIRHEICDAISIDYHRVRKHLLDLILTTRLSCEHINVWLAKLSA